MGVVQVWGGATPCHSRAGGNPGLRYAGNVDPRLRGNDDKGPCHNFGLHPARWCGHLSLNIHALYNVAMDDRRIDKSLLEFINTLPKEDQIAYWQTRTPADRLRALELLRQIEYGYDPNTTRIQRVLEIVERSGQ